MIHHPLTNLNSNPSFYPTLSSSKTESWTKLKMIKNIVEEKDCKDDKSKGICNSWVDTCSKEEVKITKARNNGAILRSEWDSFEN